MLTRIIQLYESLGTRDLVQILILAVVLFGVLRFLGRTWGSGSSIARGLGLVILFVFLLVQVVIASLDLTELGTVFDFLLTSVVIGLLVIFQPELRRGLMRLGRTSLWQGWAPTRHALADPLANAAEALSRDGVGALIAIQRQVNLDAYAETGERIDGRISVPLIRNLFMPRSPLHDGAIILVGGRIIAAGCQLPMRSHDQINESSTRMHMGMRHRAALCFSEETDAIVIVVSEETGRVSLALGGRFEAVARENLARRLADLLSQPASRRAA
ncbi:MAG: diadenylate cyclase [Planctomycetes bacterium]|nr:diadenylate cyclase [Planctomycetota bacterium]